eukprot:4769937-Pleurochrysis_carterae.AAC.1
MHACARKAEETSLARDNSQPFSRALVCDMWWGGTREPKKCSLPVRALVASARALRIQLPPPASRACMRV